MKRRSRRRARHLPIVRLTVLLICLLGLAPLDTAQAQTADAPPADRTPGQTTADPFAEIAKASGLDFVHWNGMSGQFYFPEVVGSGGALFDYDGDGDLDVYLVQGHFLGPQENLAKSIFPPPKLPARDRLFRNDLTPDADGRPELQFTEVTESSGIRALRYGMGASAADFDGDGHLDLYLTNFGPNELWRNRGDGTFEEVAAQAGVAEPRWSVAATFFDYDGDGWLDLFVGNYMDYQVTRNKACVGESGLQDYCGPQSYQATADRLFRNRGDGTFEDVSDGSGISKTFGPALGAIAADFNGDRRQDLYVANDQAANQLWLNQGDGSFVDDALLLGCALNRDGQAEASMGVDAADYDGDGDLDLFMTHLTRESHTLYVNDGQGLFQDRSTQSGLARASWQATGFGTAWFDVDNDGWLDLFTANGSVYIDFDLARQNDPYPLHQRNQLFRNLGDGTFAELTGGDALALSEVSRGALFGDLDNDGDTDIVVTNNSGPARLLRNDIGQRHHWLGLRLVGSRGNPSALGAWVVLRRPQQPPLWRRVRSDGSFAASNDPRVLVGLGTSTAVESVEVIWPDGSRQIFPGLEIDRYHNLRLDPPPESPAAPQSGPYPRAPKD